MILSKKKYLRKIRMTYNQISKMFNLPIKNKEFMIMEKYGGLHVWKNDIYKLQDWSAEISSEEVSKKLKLLPGESLRGDDYWCFYGYDLIIETTEDNLNLIKNLGIKYHNGLNPLKRFFTFKIDERFIYLKKWLKLFALVSGEEP